MAERTKAPVSKTGMGATSSWVRIPLSPPFVGTNKAPQISVCGALFVPTNFSASCDLGDLLSPTG